MMKRDGRHILTPNFAILSRSGFCRFFHVIYADDGCIVWRVKAENLHFTRLSSDENGAITSIDFDGGPLLSKGDSMFGFGKVDRIEVLDNPTSNGLMSDSFCAIVLCQRDKGRRLGKNSIRKVRKGARTASTGE